VWRIVVTRRAGTIKHVVAEMPAVAGHEVIGIVPDTLKQAPPLSLVSVGVIRTSGICCGISDIASLL
jgi:hypothetical protein